MSLHTTCVHKLLDVKKLVNLLGEFCKLTGLVEEAQIR